MPFPGMDEHTDLLQRVTAGEEAAFRTLFNAYRVKLYYFIYKIIDNPTDAEELVQDLFVRLWSSRQQLADVQNLDSYMFIAARNRAMDHLKKTARERTNHHEWLGSLDPQQTDTDHLLDYKESKQLIDDAVRQLPPQQARIFHLSKEMGMSRQAIAEELGLSENTVRNHLAEAIKTLKDHLRQHGSGALLLLLWIIS